MRLLQLSIHASTVRYWFWMMKVAVLILSTLIDIDVQWWVLRPHPIAPVILEGTKRKAQMYFHSILILWHFTS